MDHQSPFWPIFLAFTSAHLDSRLLVPSDRALFIPLVLLIRPRRASAVLSHSSFYPAYTVLDWNAVRRIEIDFLLEITIEVRRYGIKLVNLEIMSSGIGEAG